MIKCGVCGSENEAQALFCGTCGSPLTPDETKAIAEEAKAAAAETKPTDESVVPGKGGARRDLGTGGEPPTTALTSEGVGGAETTPVMPDDGTESTGPSIKCGVCGTLNDPSRTYCRKCANELKPPTGPPPVQAQPDTGRRIPPIVIGLGAAGLVVAVGVAVILALGGLGPTASSTPFASSPGGTAQVTSGPVDTTVPSQGTQPSEPPFGEGDPEGRIVFARCVNRDDCVLFMIDADGTEVGPLTDASDGSATDPSFSFDGERVAFTIPGGISILDVESGDITEHSTTPGDGSATWSPDGTMLTFTGRRNRDEPPTDDREIRLDGVAVAGTSEALTSNRTDDHDSVFTIDGLKIIWSNGDFDGRRLRIIDLASRVISSLTESGFGDVDPAVSPDGTLVAFASKRAGAGEFDLFLLELATGVISPLPKIPGDEHDPAWSPGGRYLVFSGGPQENRDLFLLDRADGMIEPLTTTGDRDVFPTWARQ